MAGKMKLPVGLESFKQIRLLLLSEGNRIFLRQIRVFGVLFEII